MRMLMKSLLTVSAALSLLPTTALAYPTQCYDICQYVACWEECAVGPRTWMTCGDYAPTWCQGVVAEPNDSTALVTTDDAAQADDASQVCSEDVHATLAES